MVRFFDKDGNELKVETVEKGKAATAPSASPVSGYTFEMWYTDKNFKNKITTIQKNIDKDISIYAKWKKVSVNQVETINLKNQKKEQLKISYSSKVSKAEGYQIQYSTSKDFKTNKVTFSNKKTTKAVEKLKKGTTYYIKVRTYKTDSAGNKIFGKYKTKKVVLKL